MQDADGNNNQVRILIVAKNVQQFQNASQFLTRRGWPSYCVGSVKEAVSTVVKFRPTFVLVSFSIPTATVTKLPNLLAQTFNVTPIAFGEGGDPTTSKRLRTCKLKHIFYGSLSGPSIHMRIKKIIMEQQREAAAAARKAAQEAAAAQMPQAQMPNMPTSAPPSAAPAAAPPGMAPPPPDAGGDEMFSDEMFSDDMEEADAPNAPPADPGLDYGNHNQAAGSGALDYGAPAANQPGHYNPQQSDGSQSMAGAPSGMPDMPGQNFDGMAPPAPGGAPGMPGGAMPPDMSGGANQPGHFNPQQSDGQNMTGAAGGMPDMPGQNFDGMAPPAPGGAPGMPGGAMPPDMGGGANQPGHFNPQQADGQNMAGAGDIPPPGAEGMPGMAPEMPGAPPTGVMAPEAAPEMPGAAGMIPDIPGMGQTPTEAGAVGDESLDADAASQGAAMADGENTGSGFDFNDEETGDSFVDPTNALFDPEAEEEARRAKVAAAAEEILGNEDEEEDHPQGSLESRRRKGYVMEFNDEQKAKTEEIPQKEDGSAKVAKEFKDTAYTDLSKAMSEAFDLACRPSGTQANPIGVNDTVGAFGIKAKDKDGYILVAWPKNSDVAESSFFLEISEALTKALKSDKIEFNLESNFQVDISPTDFINWSEQEADFVLTHQHGNHQVAIAFVKNEKGLPRVRRDKEFDDMSAIDIEDINADVKLNFDAYLNFKHSQKMIRYGKVGGSISRTQKQRLMSRQVKDMYVPNEEVNNFKSHVASDFLNSKINNYNKKVAV